MYLVLKFDEHDGQSSKKAFQVWLPNLPGGFRTNQDAVNKIAEEGEEGERYWIVHLEDPVSLKRTTTTKVETIRPFT